MAAVAALVGADWGGAASTGVTVTVNVPSSISLTNQCQAAPAWNLGTVLPGSTALSDTGANVCRMGFQSSNDSAMLRLGQRDGMGSAMTSAANGVAVQNGADNVWLDVDFVPSSVSTAIRVGPAGIQKTVDSGATWSNSTDTGCSHWSLLSVSVVDATSSWISGQGPSAGVVCRSGDGGASYTSLPSPAGQPSWVQYKAIKALSSTTAIMGGMNGALYITTNSGTSWTNIAGTIPSWSTITSIDAIDVNNIWVSADNQVFFTTNQGASWTDSAIPSCGNISSIDITSMTNVYAGGDGGCLFHYATGSWAQSGTQGQQVNGVSATGTNVAYAAMDDGQLWRTTDGATWNLLWTGTTNNLYSMVVSPTRGYAVGASMTSVTSPTGAVWTSQGSPTPTWFGVAALSATSAWAVGGGGAIKKTSDGGTTWTAQNSTVSWALRSVAATSTSTAWAVGDNGTIVATTNGGTTWAAQASTTTNRLASVAAVDGSTLWAVGDSATILKTTDGGATWVSQANPLGTNLHSVSAVSARVAFVAGDSGRAGYTTDGGATWTLKVVTGSGQNFRSISATSAADVWVVGGWNGIFRSSDGGVTWTPGGTGTSNNQIAAITSREAVMATTDGFQRTTDGGATWTDVYDDWLKNYGVAALDVHTFFVVGERDTIHRVTPAVTLPDYAAGNNWGSGAATGTFGACLQAVGAGTAPQWTRDTFNTAGKCEPLDSDPWNAIPVTPAKVAYAVAPGTAGQADFVWGFRAASNAPADTYRATVVFEALAPNV